MVWASCVRSATRPLASDGTGRGATVMLFGFRSVPQSHSSPQCRSLASAEALLPPPPPSVASSSSSFLRSSCHPVIGRRRAASFARSRRRILSILRASILAGGGGPSFVAGRPLSLCSRRSFSSTTPLPARKPAFSPPGASFLPTVRLLLASALVLVRELLCT